MESATPGYSYRAVALSAEPCASFERVRNSARARICLESGSEER